MKHLIVLLGFALAMLEPASALAQADPVSVARAFGAAENAHNVDAVVALFTEDAVITTPFGTFRGTDQIRQFVQSLVAGNIRTVGRDYQASGDQVTFIRAATTTDFLAMGVAPVDFKIVGLIQAGKIKNWDVSYTPEAAAKIQAAQARSQPSPVPAQAPRALPRTGAEAALAATLLPLGVMLLLTGAALRRRR